MSSTEARIQQLCATLRRLLCARSFPGTLEDDYLAFKHEGLAVSILVAATVISILVIGRLFFVLIPLLDMTDTELPTVAAVQTGVQAGLALAHWGVWVLLWWPRTARAARQRADILLLLLGIYAFGSFPLMPADRLLQTACGSSWTEQMELVYERHPDYFNGTYCRAWLNPLLDSSALPAGEPPCFHGFPAHGTWDLLQLWFFFSLALFLRLEPKLLLLLAHVCPALDLACKWSLGEVGASKGNMAEYDGSIAVMYVQMLSLWYAAVRYDNASRAGFKKHKNALRLASTRRWPRLTRPRGIKHDVFISHVWETGQDTSAVIKRLLAQLLPRARVFLDVDDLEDISRLAEEIDSSASVLVFLSRGYFDSLNCMRELTAAVRAGKPLILVQASRSP